jgi:glycosyltransferase involved in cell wall biosynthesis
MLQSTPVIASDAVGAVAGGLVRDGHNGLVARAGDAAALAVRLETLAVAPELRARMGAAARDDASALTPSAWADGVSDALAAVSVGM